MENERELLEQLVMVASGQKQADLVLKNADVVNVFTEELERADVAIVNGRIAGIGTYEGNREVDLSGCVIAPGFIDGHIHLESSMVQPAEFERIVLPRGTTTVVVDPHEIANVAGAEGIDYILSHTEKLDLDVFVMLPSCVPATNLDEAGAVLLAKDLTPYYQNERVLGLAEVMNAHGVVHGQQEILDKIQDAAASEKLIDGHAPGLSGLGLNAYAAAGIRSDHECSELEEAVRKIRRGQWIMIREGTAAQNLNALIGLTESPYYHRCMFCTDDKHPGDLMEKGHIDYIIRKAAALGADKIRSIRMASLHAAQYFGLTDRGAVAPGYIADLAILKDLDTFEVMQVYKNGICVAREGTRVSGTDEAANIISEDLSGWTRVMHSFHLKEITAADLQLNEAGNMQRVICLTPFELLTTEQTIPYAEHPGYAKGVDIRQDIVKLAVLERHHGTGHIGLGFLGGYGLKKGAVATSVSHDSHNLIVAGVTDEDMVLAINTVREMEGGLAVVSDGIVLGTLALPVGGVMSLESAETVERQLILLKGYTRDLGIAEGIDAFMTLAFVSLPVIPELRLNTYGLIHVEDQTIWKVLF
ncbi:MAG: adenine deaminase [Lachnospiraceae bacterium]